MLTFDVAVVAPTAHDALIECARAGIPGPVITSDEGCLGHMHALITADDYDGELVDQLTQLVQEDTSPFVGAAIYEV